MRVEKKRREDNELRIEGEREKKERRRFRRRREEEKWAHLI